MEMHELMQRQLQELMRENYYLRQRILELERENQRINLMLAAKTLVINKIEFKLDNIDIETLNGVLQIGLSHQAESVNVSDKEQLPKLKDGPSMGV